MPHKKKKKKKKKKMYVCMYVRADIETGFIRSIPPNNPINETEWSNGGCLPSCQND